MPCLLEHVFLLELALRLQPPTLTPRSERGKKTCTAAVSRVAAPPPPLHPRHRPERPLRPAVLLSDRGVRGATAPNRPATCSCQFRQVVKKKMRRCEVGTLCGRVHGCWEPGASPATWTFSHPWMKDLQVFRGSRVSKISSVWVRSIVTNP